MKAIFFTDVHLVSKTNVNRVDNLPETQKLKLKELINWILEKKLLKKI